MARLAFECGDPTVCGSWTVRMRLRGFAEDAKVRKVSPDLRNLLFANGEFFLKIKDSTQKILCATVSYEGRRRIRRKHLMYDV